MSKSWPTPRLWLPKNTSKYKGDYNNIWIRSSWELKVYKWLDTNQNVIRWSSEEVFIPYISPIDNKWHRYFPDAWAEIKTKNKIETFLIEIKPYRQTIEPQVKKKVTKSYINEVVTWGVNSAKWEATKKFCKERGWIFRLMTEQEIE